MRMGLQKNLFCSIIQSNNNLINIYKHGSKNETYKSAHSKSSLTSRIKRA